ncbi:MAG: recombinase family protein [Oscillospiraceae bacterium]|nr:recombinase family protein [Oscillospiraceae bacterium]
MAEKEKTYIGYVRVSSTDQNEARQLKALENFGKPMHRIFIDKCSGKTSDRPELRKMLDYVRDGDVLVVAEYARLARSSADMLKIVHDLQEKGVEIVSLRENFDTTTPQGRFMLTVFAGLAELERETILERQREGIAIAKAQGKYKGRQPIPIDEERFKTECAKWRAGQQTAKATMKKLGMKPTRFYRKVKEFGV